MAFLMGVAKMPLSLVIIFVLLIVGIMVLKLKLRKNLKNEEEKND
jgi:hypothetical protein